MKSNLVLLNLILIVNNFANLINCNKIGVPVLIWSNLNENKLNNNFDSIKSQSFVNQIPYNVLSDDYLNSKTVIAFVQNHLSLEQFSNNNGHNLNTISNIINDRTAEPLLLTDVLDPIEAIKDYSVQDTNRININNGQKVVINLPKKSLLENDELIGELLAKISQNVTKDALYLLTGRQNSYKDLIDNEVELEDNNHFGRHILSEDYEDFGESPRIGNQTEDLKKLVDVDNCLYFFSSFLTVNHYNESLANISTPIVSFDKKPEVANSSECWHINATKSEQISPALLSITFRNNTYSLRIELTIDSPFYRNKTDFWRIEKGLAYLEADSLPETRYHLIVSDISSENLFSYSCSKLTIFSQVQNETHGYPKISLVFNNFQLQPFKNPRNVNATNNGKDRFFIFADSLDCETFMTLPLWMGLLTILLFFIILFSGIYFLSQVNTPDRFENPKGKPLMITSFDE